MHKILLWLFLTQGILSQSWFAQENRIDSLLSVLKLAKEDSVKVNTLNELFLEYEFEDEAKAKEYLNNALSLSQKVDYKKGIAITYMYLGFFADDQSNYPEALKNYKASLKTFTTIQNKKGMANAYNSIGSVFYAQGNYPMALQNHLASLKIRESIGDTKGIASSYGNIGNVYNDQGNYPKALNNYFSCLNIMQTIGNKKGIATTYNNIALVYTDQHNYQEALKNHLAGLKMREELEDEKGIASSYNNIGLVYFYQGNYSQAVKNYFISLKMKEKIGDKASIAGAYCNIGEVFLKQNKHQEAQDYLIKAKQLSQEIGYRENLRNTYNALAELADKTGNYKSAYENHKLYILYRDSLNNEDTREKIIQNQMTYDFEKKEAIASSEHKKELENQQLLAEEKSRKQKLIIAFVAIGLLLVIVFAGFIFRSLRVTRKQKRIIELQKNYVEHQKQEVEHQKLLVEEKQKEIIDSITYAKRLQKAILPSDEEIRKHLQNSFILYKPKDIVAGDFYWLHVSANDEVVFIAAADSTGHGVPGAMVSVVCSNALNRAVNEFNLLDTGEILGKTRELVLETFAKSGEEIKDGMDISLLAIHRKHNKVYWSGANNQLWHIQSDQDVMMREIKADKQPIGKTENPKPFTTHKIEINAGDIFYLMTDGYADQFGGPKGKKYKYKSLEQKLIAISQLSLPEQQEILNNNFNNWRGDLEQVDDVTIIGIRI